MENLTGFIRAAVNRVARVDGGLTDTRHAETCPVFVDSESSSVFLKIKLPPPHTKLNTSGRATIQVWRRMCSATLDNFS